MQLTLAYSALMTLHFMSDLLCINNHVITIILILNMPIITVFLPKITSIGGLHDGKAVSISNRLKFGSRINLAKSSEPCLLQSS